MRDMLPPRRLTPLTVEQLSRLPEARLIAYRREARSLEESLESSDYSHDKNIEQRMDTAFIWFKADPRWQPLYDQILKALHRVQSVKKRSPRVSKPQHHRAK